MSMSTSLFVSIMYVMDSWNMRIGLVAWISSEVLKAIPFA